MTHEAIWFGPGERPLAGFLHEPSDPPIGGVVICPPFAYEATCAHRTLRRIADRLAEQGHLALRFDYEGTGASSGSGFGSGLLDRWQRNVLAGVAELRRRGVQRPTLVGLRLGAALACAAAGRDADLGGLALWAPVTSGRRYWRELRAQAAITPHGTIGDGSLNIVGHHLPADAVRALKSWDPLRDVDPNVAMLVVQSPGWRGVDDAAADLVGRGLRPEFLDVEGTSAVLERDAELAEVPVPLVDALCRWVDKSSGRQTLAAAVPRLREDKTRVINTRTGPVEEQIVAVPPRGLYGVVTRPIGQSARTGVIFLNNGVAPAAGPGRAWVEFARTLAASGVTSLRLDFSGVGDSPDLTRHPIGRDKPVPRIAGRELLAAVDFLRAGGMRDITAVGLCSGAQIAVRTAAYRGRIDNVFAINPALYHLPDIGVGPWMRRLWALTAFPMSKRPVRAAIHRLPERVWAVLDRLGIFPSPAGYLRRAAARQTWVRLVFAEGDGSLDDLRVRSGRAVAQMVADGQMSLDVVAGMDHSMFDRERRAEVLEALCETCLRSAQPLDRQASS
jgi:alpha/beta superfamily hydrolase